MEPGKPNWFAVVSKPRQEQIALENLQRQGFECFLPMAENPHQRRSKKHQRIVEPLFPRYLFLKAIASHQNLAPVRSTMGVLGMVRFGMELAVALDISLGKTNYCLKALINKGLIKAKNFKNNDNKRAYLYILTPKGIETKARISVKYLLRKIAEYEALSMEIEQLKTEIDINKVNKHP